MSTEGSVSTSSSGIRQFGLYRTIDARTEEFLRLSRKRQIRQGCACAAISTAITVTVVITMILIYEYSVIHESSSKISIKQNWLSLMNKSAEAIPFEAKLNKAKLNLDPMYMQFLPLILKPLKKNKYFDKLLEDDSTKTPLSDKAEEPVDMFTKNIFSDSSNWMRVATPSLYTIEYKTSPIVYFKYPTRNIDHFTKIRRIRDYQRIMNYVDKMISDKVAFTSTIPMLKNSYSFHKRPPLVTYSGTTPMSKIIDYVTKKHAEEKNPKQNSLNKAKSIIKKKSACRCPKRLNQLISKLIKCLQKIIPDFIGSEQMSACNKNKLKTDEHKTKQQEHTSSKQLSEVIMKNDQSDAKGYSNNNLQNTKSINASDSVIVTPNINNKSTLKKYQTMTPNTISLNKTFYSVKPLHANIDFTLSSIINLIKPHLTQNEIKQDLNSQAAEQVTEETGDFFPPEDSTKPLTKTETDIMILQKNNLNTTEKSLLKLTASSDTENGDYLTTDMVDNFKILDVHSFELTKKAMLADNDEKNNKGNADLETFTTHPSLELTNSNQQEYNDTWKLLRKMGKLTFSLTKFHNTSNDSIKKSNETAIVNTVVVKENADSNIPSALIHGSTNSYSYLSENKPQEQLKNDDLTLEEETDNVTAEEIVAEDSLKNLENLLNKINISQIFNSTFKKKTEKETAKLGPHGHIQNRKFTETTCQHSNSMIPENRPSYLEMQRNDWKREDEHPDYDNPIVLLIYEYMIVVETSAVQNRTGSNKIRFVGKDKPIAERLDRSHFGFDQDYYERMPLLVNALQEVSYVDPKGESSVSRSRKRQYSRNRFKLPTTTADNRFIKRTSPRPFTFEYRSPYPMPFSKSQGTSRNWAEYYRNAQRLKNLHDVVKYLEKTLNAKFGDVYLPTRTQIAFSGIYMPPSDRMNRDSYLPINDNISQESQNYNVKSNHNSDPLYTFRPDSPGDINLLAEGFRFAPSIFTSQNNLKPDGIKHVYRAVAEKNKQQNCRSLDCTYNHSSFSKKAEVELIQEDETSMQKYDEEPKVLDIKVNVFSSQKPPPESTLNRSNINKIYITSPRPMFQFRRKSTMPYRRSMYTYKRPNIFVEKRKNITITTSKTGENKTIIFKRLVPLSSFTANDKAEKISDQHDAIKNTKIEETTVNSKFQNNIKIDYVTDYPILNYSHVEDYHVGSSGIIPIESRTIMPIFSYIPITESNFEKATTNAPELIKFSPEDAKVPDHYLNLRKSDTSKITEKQNSNFNWDYSENTETYTGEVETETLIIKLKNMIETTTSENVFEKIENSEIDEDDSQTTTSETYVPQINGHHRHVNFKSLTTLLRENSERYRKKRIENLVTTRVLQNNTYVPMYVEIKRNRSSIDYEAN